jgi:hypothetical protein
VSPAVSRAANQMCETIQSAEVAGITGVSAQVVPESSGALGCTYQIESGGPGSYQVTIRTEDSFPDLGTVRSTFPDGHDVRDLGDDAYWATAVTTLWFEQRGSLYAVQLLSFDADGAAALAEALGHLASSRL